MIVITPHMTSELRLLADRAALAGNSDDAALLHALLDASEDAEGQRAKLADEVADLKGKLDEAEGEARCANDEIAQADDRLAEVRSERDALEDQVAALEKRLAEAKAVLS